jgi:hypothetical protein
MEVVGVRAMAERAMFVPQTSTKMKEFQYAVLYVFQVKPDRQADFEEAWEAVTDFIQSENGSGGSRLYRASETTYWAHALWPSKEALVSAQLPVQAANAREVMVDTCESIESMGEGTLVCDRWSVEG